MRLLLFLVILFLLDLYFYLGTISSINKLIDYSFFYKAIYWVLSASIYCFLLYFIIIYKGDSKPIIENGILYSSLFIILFFSKLLGSIPLFIDDVIRLFKLLLSFFIKTTYEHDIQRLDFLKKSALVVSGTLFSTLLLGMTWGRYNFKKNKQDIYIKRWPKEFNEYKIIHISDLHLGSFGSVNKLEVAVEMINDENPDMVVFTGDLVNDYYKEAIPYVDTLKKIKSKDGKYSILGNHDYGDYTGLSRESLAWHNNFNNLLKLEKEAGFDLLLNEARTIYRGDSSFNLVGVENWGAGGFSKEGDIDVAMNNIRHDIPAILLSHDPSHWTEVILKSSYDIDLQLSGHTHGMQFGVELGKIKWSPIKYRYKYWAGLYKQYSKQIYVNRGLGHLAYAGRVGIMPDISILTIKRG